MPRLALEHIRILDLTQAWAGTYATQILADHGAEVIKVEARQRLESWRAAPNVHPKDGPGERPYNRAFLANSVNRNKYGITLDLTRERGRELFRRLVPSFDVVTENFTPRVMGKFGLGFEALHELRPGLIMLSLPAYGRYGPYSPFPGIGGTAEPMSGNSDLLGYEGEPPLNSGVMYPDPVAAIFGTSAVLTALHYRSQTGRGQHIDLSQQESMMNMLGYQAMAYFLAGEAPRRRGNQDPYLVPHRNYRCQGEDQWVAIAARNDADWAALCQALGRLELAEDRRFATSIARVENRSIVDLIVEEWTGKRAAEEVQQTLEKVGVPVGKVRTMAELYECPHLNARDFFLTVDHPEVGRHPTPGIPSRLSRTPGNLRRPAPCLGQHSAGMLRRFLGLSDEEIAELIAEGITGEGPVPEAIEANG